MKGHVRIAPVGATEHQRDLAGTNNVSLHSESVASLDRPAESSAPATGDIGPTLDPDGAPVVGGYEIVSGIGASASANAAVSRELGGEPRDIGTFAHPDAVPREFDGEPRDIGTLAHPDAVPREFDGEPRDIGAFAHPDAVPREFDGEPRGIGAFAHPDAVPREFDDEPRDIGAFADPDVAVSPDSGGEPRDTGDFLEPDG